MPIIINCVQRTTCSYAKTGLKSKGKFWIHFLWKVWLMYGLVSMERIGHNLRHIKVAIKKKRSWYSKQILVYISICSHITKIFLLRGTVKESEFLSQNFPLQKGTTFVFQNLEWLALFFSFQSTYQKVLIVQESWSQVYEAFFCDMPCALEINIQVSRRAAYM